MPWVTFARDFDFSPAALQGRVTIAFKRGMRKMVTRECAAAARLAGAVDSPAAVAAADDEAKP